ncbi:DMT family transporter [Cohnella nanjingensis]|uniref:EamA family transporter n=1 Tax=Cohnella nanjingensis TaxID=1387779 RepID=A0A7X0VDG0_9BACL|nr:EamA family transporter [Cohnella nanjingensis]MBB6669925.1 EamA family transporter [Cohnella nanjingensis]
MSKKTFAALLLLTTFAMGTAFPVGRLGLDYASPFLLMGIRFVLAGGIMALATIKRPKPRGARAWGKMALLGTFNSACVMGCAYYSMRWITSGESAILIFVNPLLVIVLGTLFLGARYGGRQWAGVALGLAGVVCTFGTHFHVQPGTFIGLAGAVFFATAALLMKRWGPSFDVWVLSGYQMLAGGVVLLVLSALSEHPHFELNLASAGVMLWLVLISSIVQFSAWTYLLRQTDPGRTSAFLFLAPLFSVLTGWGMLGEPLHAYVGAGGALICVGIFLVNWQARKRSLAADIPQKVAEM